MLILRPNQQPTTTSTTNNATNSRPRLVTSTGSSTPASSLPLAGSRRWSVLVSSLRLSPRLTRLLSPDREVQERRLWPMPSRPLLRSSSPPSRPLGPALPESRQALLPSLRGSLLAQILPPRRHRWRLLWLDFCPYALHGLPRYDPVQERPGGGSWRSRSGRSAGWAGEWCGEQGREDSAEDLWVQGA
jgi:hypothetical protein